MFKQWNHYQLLMICIGMVFITTACLQNYEEGVGAQPVSQLIESATPIPTQELEPTAIPTDIPDKPTETSTATPTTTPSPTETEIPATLTMTIDPLLMRLTQTEESDELVNIGNTVPGGTAVAQVPTDEAPDDFALTATALIGQLTQDAAAVATTQAFEAGLGSTPTPIATITPDPLLASPTIASQGTNLIPGADCVHQIRAGETLYKLSLAYGVSVGEMANASGITNWNIVLVGQRITIPGCGTTGFAPPPTSVPIPSSTPVLNTQTSAQTTVTGAGDSTVTTDTLAAQAQEDIINNAQADIQANAVVQGVAPATGSRTYTVQQYDTLFQIAVANGTTVDAIAALNGITNINSITMGDVLQIP